jgi:hypothetical protein
MKEKSQSHLNAALFANPPHKCKLSRDIYDSAAHWSLLSRILTEISATRREFEPNQPQKIFVFDFTFSQQGIIYKIREANFYN